MPWKPVARSAATTRMRTPDTRPSANERGYGSQWRLVRAAFLCRYPACAYCHRPATDVHHIIPRRMGGGDDEANLISLCHSCHSKVTSRGG